MIRHIHPHIKIKGTDMDDTSGHSLSWARAGSLCGLAAAVVFLTAQFAPIPDRVGNTLIMFFGPLMMLGFVGFYHYLLKSAHRVLIQAAVIYGIIAGAFIDMMIIVQLSVVYFRREALASLPEGVSEAAVKSMYQVGNAVQLGMDVAFDMFILPALILFGIGLLSSTPGNKILGAIGVALGVMGLFYNLYTFPVPPIDVGYIDVGPFAMLWTVVVSGKVALESWRPPRPSAG